MKTFGPTEKQIGFVEHICKVLNITDFPISSKEFTKYHFSKFIQEHIEEYKMELLNNDYDLEWCYENCINDAWCEHY